ncbi:MAG: hypothetical protein LBP50_06260 [Tannerella sp.]|jgi:hypothetical protein|nr:hypothetical protein [Tannerella sp.]
MHVFDGLSLNPNATALADGMADTQTLTMHEESNGSWKFEIKPKTDLRAASVTDAAGKIKETGRHGNLRPERPAPRRTDCPWQQRLDKESCTVNRDIMIRYFGIWGLHSNPQTLYG